MIIELAISGSRKPFNDYYGVDRSCTECDPACHKANANAACLVSRTFRDITQPILFRVIDLSSPETSSLVWHTLSKNVHLRKHCRRLVIVNAPISKPSKKVLLQWKGILRWSVNVQCIQLHIEMTSGEVCWNLTKKLATHAHRLKHLSLSGEYWYSNFVRIINIVDFPRLTKLDVDYLGCHDWDPYWKYWRTPVAPDKQRISPVPSLTIEDENDDPECALSLVTWSKALENFVFQMIGEVPKSSTILLALTKSLLIHERTLKSVDISHVANASHLFDARLFSNLEYLRLSRWHLAGALEFTQEYTKILGPSLKVFVWNFDDIQQLRDFVILGDFDEDEELWLRELATAAADSKLQELRIEFTPVIDVEAVTELYHDGFTYPWDRMDEIRDTVMRRIGVSLTYNEPSVSREVWDMHENCLDDGELTQSCCASNIPVRADRESESEVDSEVESVAESEREPRDEEEVEEVDSEHD
jgi:hypothetical protein